MINKAVTYLEQGKIIAYPTEGVYGLGCDPFNEQAVLKLLALKKRCISKGLILITNDWHAIQDLTQSVSDQQLAAVKEVWPGPTTWVFPANEKVPSWLLGKHDTIAIRMTTHPIAKQLCEAFQKPIISTSANPSGLPPAKTAEEVAMYFKQHLAFILEGKVGNLTKPTPIYDVLTGKLLRD